MLNPSENLVLNFILNECGDDYKVLEITDFEDFLLQKNIKRKINIKNILKHLQTNNFINIRYFDDDRYCLCATQLSKQIFEKEIIEKNKLKKIKVETILLILIFFISAILGSFLGTLLYYLIM